MALDKEIGPGQGLDGLVVLVRLVLRLWWEPYDRSSVGDDYGAVADRVRVGDVADFGDPLEDSPWRRRRRRQRPRPRLAAAVAAVCKLFAVIAVPG